jgi:hypothetical protein
MRFLAREVLTVIIWRVEDLLHVLNKQWEKL